VRWQGRSSVVDRMADPSRMAEALEGFVERLAPVHASASSVTEAWDVILPPNLRQHCTIGAITGGTIKVIVDAASYMYELQLCKDELLAELRRLCPGAGLRRMQIAMARGRRP